MKKLIWLFLVVLTTTAHADENLFGYSNSTDTTPKGAVELYQWVTYRSQKATGTYEALDYRTEIEYGWTDRLSQSLYLNFRQHDIQNSAPEDENGDPLYGNIKTGMRFQGVQSDIKYNIFSPYKEDFGLALYFEPGYSRIFKISGERQDEYSLEFKLLFQKNFFENQMTTVFNLNFEPEVRRFYGNQSWEKEIAIEATTGVSYRFIPNWFGGLEARYHSEYPDWGKREHWAVFLGPNVHYGSERWWFTFTAFPQFAGGPRVKGENVHLSEHEKTEYRLKVGYNF